jgi:two-component system KDP operon response regulator KdpE
MSAHDSLSVLVVEDDDAVRALISLTVQQLGWHVEEAATAQAAMLAVEASPPDLVLLDIGLPDASGLDVLRRIRRLSATPVVVLSGASDDASKVALLDAGADDYLVKPIGAAELQARLRAHARRLEADRRSADEFEIRVGGVEVDLLRRRVLRDGQEIRLTPTEWSLLRALAKHADTPVSSDTLWDLVWGREFGDAKLNVRVHILHLRRKIEPSPQAPVLLVNVPGSGYMLRTRPSASDA